MCRSRRYTARARTRIPSLEYFQGREDLEGVSRSLFFEVDDVKAAFKEINGGLPEESAFRMDKFGSVSYRVFFVVAPDGLCYMLGERQE